MSKVGLHWESWILRGLVLGAAIFHAASGNAAGGLVAAQGFLLSLLPPLVERLSHVHVPRVVELAFVFGTTLQYLSESLKLFGLLTYWDKIVHPALIALTASIAALLATIVGMWAYRHTLGVDRRSWLGAIGTRVGEATNAMLERHPALLTSVLIAGVVAAVASLWFADRALPR